MNVLAPPVIPPGHSNRDPSSFKPQRYEKEFDNLQEAFEWIRATSSTNNNKR